MSTWDDHLGPRLPTLLLSVLTSHTKSLNQSRSRSSDFRDHNGSTLLNHFNSTSDCSVCVSLNNTENFCLRHAVPPAIASEYTTRLQLLCLKPSYLPNEPIHQFTANCSPWANQHNTEIYCSINRLCSKCKPARPNTRDDVGGQNRCKRPFGPTRTRPSCFRPSCRPDVNL